MSAKILVFFVIIFYTIQKINHFFYYRSSVGNKFAKNRAIIFAAIGILFLTAGVGVTVSNFYSLSWNTSKKLISLSWNAGEYFSKICKTTNLYYIYISTKITDLLNCVVLFLSKDVKLMLISFILSFFCTVKVATLSIAKENGGM